MGIKKKYKKWYKKLKKELDKYGKLSRYEMDKLIHREELQFFQREAYRLERENKALRESCSIEEKCTPVPYQACPICNGSGITPADGFTSGSYQNCTICTGEGIIPEFTEKWNIAEYRAKYKQ